MRENEICIPGFQYLTLTKLHIKKSVNEHIWASVSGIFSKEIAASIVGKGVSNQAFQIIVSEDGLSQKNIFNGIVYSVVQHQENDVFFLDIIAVSRSIMLDQDTNLRVFQNTNQTFQSIAKTVAKQAGAGIVATEGEKAINRLFVQYDETDWAFLLRLAGHANSFLVSDYILDDPFISFGMPRKSSKAVFDEYAFSTGKNLMDYYRTVRYKKKNIHENDFLYFIVTSREIFELCSEVQFMNRTLFIYEITSNYIGGELIHRYVLRSKEGFRKMITYNQNLQGACLPATVSKVQKDKVQVQFDNDKIKDESKYWFTLTTPYSAQGASGWYFMPCETDRVHIHFPSFEGHDAYATIAQTSSINCDNPQTQVLQSQHGHFIAFSEKQIEIRSVTGSNIVMSDTDGIQMHSQNDLVIDAGTNLTLTAGSGIHITSDSGIRLCKNSSTITLEDDILIKGDRIKLKQ